ncbi:hypothetical protein P3X46_033810, partial [Hevea brasiliensis]
YDCTIQYHPGKANVVADALSRKSSGSLAHISAEKRPLIREVHELMDQGLILDLSDEGVLLAHFSVRICVPDVDNLRNEIMQEAHYTLYNVHPGSTKMYHDVKDSYWWNGMKRDIADFVYHSSIGMAPYEALYGRKCRSPLCWTEMGESKVHDLDLVQYTSEVVPLIRERLKTNFQEA